MRRAWGKDIYTSQLFLSFVLYAFLWKCSRTVRCCSELGNVKRRYQSLYVSVCLSLSQRMNLFTEYVVLVDAKPTLPTPTTIPTTPTTVLLLALCCAVAWQGRKNKMPTPLPAKVPPNVAEEIPWYHPESRYEEPWKDAYLTLFDVHRKPRRIMDHPNQRVSLPLKLLGNEFQCPICLGYMKGTSIVMECLHRFCRDCIQKCLRLGKKQCPSCRIHIPSRRSLRPDPKFDLLIKHMCGNLDDLEKQEEKEIEILNMSKHMNNTCTESRRKGILQQHNQRKKYNSSRLSNSRIDPVQGGSSSINNTVGGVSGVHQKSKARQRPSIINLKPSPLLEFLLRRHPQERRVDRLAREQLKVNIEATVGLLKTFLSRKLNYAPSGHFQILSTVSDTSVILDDSITLEEIRRELYDVAIEEMITLQYRIFPPSCETSTTGTNTL